MAPTPHSPSRAAGQRDLRRLLPPADVRRLDNGLTVCVARQNRAPVVATAVVYRVGGRDEGPAEGGAAHFLEHMMFKGSEHFGPGDVDRLTRALGGSNNAYTSQDATLYYFTFAADRWRRALDVEVDRMASLTLDPQEVASERQVILEEIAMYEGEPWDALDEAVHAAFFPRHPYGRPVLGTRRSLAGLDGPALADFHRRFYRPDNAVVAVVGDVDPAAAHEAVAERFGALAAGGVRRPESVADPGAGVVRIERHQGELARLLVALPSPAAVDPDHPALRLWLSVLGSGRSSRLHRRLVDEGQLCVWVSADVQENLEPASLSIAGEVVPGVDPAEVEAAMMEELRTAVAAPPTAEELARAKQMIFADWLFGHEKVDQQAFLLGTSLALFDVDYPWRYLERLLAAGADDLARVAERYLDADRRAVVGWSLPRR